MKVHLFEDFTDPIAQHANTLAQSWPSASIMQSIAWPKIAIPSRMQTYCFFVCSDKSGETVAAGCVRMAHLYRGRFSGSFRRGPCTRTPEDLARVMPALEDALLRRGAISVAVNPHWQDDDATVVEEILTREKYVTAPEDEQSLPSATALIDLKPSEEDLLRSFSQRRRRDLRSPNCGDFQIRPVKTLEEAARLSDIMKEMARRTGMEIDRQHAFTNHFRVLEAHPDLGWINAAFVDGELLGGSVSYREAHRGYALLVATSSGMSGSRSTSLYWQNILDAKRLGLKELDLVGYPDPRRPASDLNAGRQEFKGSFRPRVVTLPPIMTKVLRPMEVSVYRSLRQLYRKSPWRTHLKDIIHRSY